MGQDNDRKDTDKPARQSALGQWWEGMEPSRRRAIVRGYVILVILLLCGAGVVYGMRTMDQKVASGPNGVTPTRLRVAMIEPPEGMPVSLLHNIAVSLSKNTPADPNLTEHIYNQAAANPWVAKVLSVTRKADSDPKSVLVEVRAEYRLAVARVAPPGGGEPEYIDREGVRLPATDVAQYFVSVPAAKDRAARKHFFIRRADIGPGWHAHPIHYITIDGVQDTMPAIGQKWSGADLAEGMKLLNVIAAKPYANQIRVVDVRNFDGRHSPSESSLCLRAQVGAESETIIRFGRFPDPTGDWETRTERKLHNLDAYVTDQKGRLAGTAIYIDLRGPDLRFRPLDSVTEEAAG